MDAFIETKQNILLIRYSTKMNGQHSGANSLTEAITFKAIALSHLRWGSSQFFYLVLSQLLNLNMAILRINEFIERTEIQVVNCPRCHGFMNESSMTKLDALKFILGLKNIPKRYSCPDCLKQTKK